VEGKGKSEKPDNYIKAGGKKTGKETGGGGAAGQSSRSRKLHMDKTVLTLKEGKKVCPWGIENLSPYVRLKRKRKKVQGKETGGGQWQREPSEPKSKTNKRGGGVRF